MIPELGHFALILALVVAAIQEACRCWAPRAAIAG